MNGGIAVTVLSKGMSGLEQCQQHTPYSITEGFSFNWHTSVFSFVAPDYSTFNVLFVEFPINRMNSKLNYSSQCREGLSAWFKLVCVYSELLKWYIASESTSDSSAEALH